MTEVSRKAEELRAALKSRKEGRVAQADKEPATFTIGTLRELFGELATMLRAGIIDALRETAARIEMRNEKWHEATLDRLADQDRLLKQVAENRPIVNLPDAMRLTNPEDVAKFIVLPDRVFVKNLGDIKIPKGEKFPKEVADKILSAVDALDMIPIETTITKRDLKVQRVVEIYRNFRVVSDFNRVIRNNGSEDLTITTQVIRD